MRTTMISDFDTHKFWQDVDGSDMPENTKAICRPEAYLDYHNVTDLICSKIIKYVPIHGSIVELGCGTGRNLAGLKRLRYKDIGGIEINKSAILLGKRRFPGLRDVPIRGSSIEEAMNDMPAVDCLFTMCSLMHLPPKSEWVFEAMSKKAREYIITLELETPGLEDKPVTIGGNTFAWVRRYDFIFRSLGWIELEHQSCEDCKPLLGKDNILRVFSKPQ